jgi:hypothetical protein
VDTGLFQDDASGTTGDDAGTGVMVLPARGTSKRFFFASSVPFWMASGTSFALP